MSRSLPTQRTWSALAELFSDDIGEVVGAVSGRLEALLGPVRERPFEGTGEVDGYSGFSRRGSYERLLLSEWLLADEAPDEFLRRAATRTHAFHAFARRSPEVDRTTLVLLDCGPEQIGAPRLGQIAALVALDRRAARSSTAIAWGFLTDPDAPLRTDVDEAAFHGFLGAHSDRVPAADAARRLVDRAKDRGPFTEIWLVGGGSIRHQLGVPSARRIQIEDLFEPTRRAIDVAVSGPSEATRTVTIDLPDHAISVRMLRHPFRANPVATAGRSTTDRSAPSSREYAIDLRRGLQLSSTGSRVLGVRTDGAAIAIGVSGHGATKEIRHRIIRPRSGSIVVAIGFHGKQLAVVTADARSIALSVGRGPEWSAVIDAEDLAALASGRVARLVPWGAIHGDWAILGDCVSLDLGHPSGDIFRAQASDLCALVPHRGRAADGKSVDTVYPVRELHAHTLSVGSTRPDTVEGGTLSMDFEDAAFPAEVFCASSRADGGSAIAFAAVRGGAMCWNIVNRPFKVPLRPPGEPIVRFSEGEVVGLVMHGAGPAFVVKYRHSIRIVLRRGTSDLGLFEATFAAPITQVAVAAEAPIVAVATEDGTIQVYDVVLRRMLTEILGRSG